MVVDTEMAISSDNIINAADGLRKLNAKAAKEANVKDLLNDEESECLSLQVVCHKIPNLDTNGKSIKKSIKISLPHPIVNEDTNVILITKDIEKGLKPDHEPTVHHFTDLLREKGCLGLVSTVIPLRQLKTEYKEFEAKIKLSKFADVILCDETILRLVPKFLGKNFYKVKKIPIPVNLKADDLKKALQTAISLSFLHLSNTGSSSQITVAKVNQPNEEIVQNIEAVMEKLKSDFPGGLENIKSVSLKTRTSISVPLLVNTKPFTGKIVMPKKQKKKHYTMIGPFCMEVDTGSFKIKTLNADKRKKLYAEGLLEGVDESQLGMMKDAEKKKKQNNEPKKKNDKKAKRKSIETEKVQDDGNATKKLKVQSQDDELVESKSPKQNKRKGRKSIHKNETTSPVVSGGPKKQTNVESLVNQLADKETPSKNKNTEAKETQLEKSSTPSKNTRNKRKSLEKKISASPTPKSMKTPVKGSPQVKNKSKNVKAKL